MAFNSDCLATYLPQLREAAHCYVAYSGGLDSHVLLHAMVNLMGRGGVSAIHVNHQLSDNAGHWQRHCERQCETLGVNLHSDSVEIDARGQGLEQAARRARYDVFKKLLGTGDLLLMAHHADDQAETVLYRLLRGSGAKGLSGIPEQRRLGKGVLLRPLLSFSRKDLEGYAHSHHLKWIDDESNFVIDFDRNFLRHQVLPAIADRWPDYAQRLSHSASLCSDTDGLLTAVAEDDLYKLSERPERLGWSVPLPELLDLSMVRRANLIRYWSSRRGFVLPGHRVLETIERELFLARQDAAPNVCWGGAALRRYGERVYLLPDVNFDACRWHESIPWSLSDPLALPGGGMLAANSVTGSGLNVGKGSLVEVRCRHGGERCRPLGRSGSNTLKKLLQEAGLEHWLRDSAPLVYVDGELAAVADLWVCEGFEAGAGETGQRLEWVLNDRF